MKLYAVAARSIVNCSKEPKLVEMKRILGQWHEGGYGANQTHHLGGRPARRFEKSGTIDAIFECLSVE